MNYVIEEEMWRNNWKIDLYADISFEGIKAKSSLHKSEDQVVGNRAKILERVKKPHLQIEDMFITIILLIKLISKSDKLATNSLMNCTYFSSNAFPRVLTKINFPEEASELFNEMSKELIGSRIYSQQRGFALVIVPEPNKNCFEGQDMLWIPKDIQLRDLLTDTVPTTTTN